MPNKTKDTTKTDQVEKKEIPAPKVDETKELQEKIVGLETIISDQNNKNLRILAEIENLRKRSAQELEKANKYAVSKFAGELVFVVENLFLACDNAPQEEIEQSDSLKNFAMGVTMTKNELIKVLEQNGIKRIYPLNEKFDHNFHEAMSQTEGGGESETIKKVIQAGYTIGDRLIKPALVEVIK